MKLNQKIEPSKADRVRVLCQATVTVAERLRINSTQLGLILGVSQPSASRLIAGRYQLSEKTKEWEMAVMLVRLFRSLFSIVGNDDQLAKDWLHSKNRAFDDQTPLNVIQKAIGLVDICSYLDAYRAKV
jgi:uncharacterized protein (DUF2384 family)